MNYHINTILIWDSFKKKDCDCPVCEIEAHIEKQLIDRYLNEAVMQDHCRSEVNKYGFCSKHFLQLYAGHNKLGLALQAHTRLIALKKNIPVTDNLKNAAKTAEQIKKELSDCTICRLLCFNMEGYYKTLPSLYSNDAEFKKLFLSSNGFCLNHYAKLINSAKHAAPLTKEFLADISSLQIKNLEKLEKNLLYFTEKFDYRNASKPWGESEFALKKAINVMCGKLLE